MPPKQNQFLQPATVTTDKGSTRRVGFELEFSGIGLDDASRAVEKALGGTRSAETAAEHAIDVPGLGIFNVEIDWSYLKRKADEVANGKLGSDWVEQLSKAAPLLVPIEVVCPPIAVNKLDALLPLTRVLREAGAVGTEESLIAAYGVHINPDLPALDAPTIGRYAQAFALLQWWLVAKHEVDPMRRITPYIDPWPDAYLKVLLASDTLTMDQLFEDYLLHNATRNRGLDLLPLLAEIDEERVRKTVADPRINARPTFHYRLPNCHIERENWSLADSWNIWCTIEDLAQRPDALRELSSAFRAADRPILGLQHGDWVAYMDTWLHDQE